MVALAYESEVDFSVGVVAVLRAVDSDRWSVVRNNLGSVQLFGLEIEE